MAWKANKRAVADGFPDLKYLPRHRSGWDMTLASYAYGVRRHLASRAPDLGAWAARHGAAASGRAEAFGPDAMVLWHGTSRARAEKIAEHGLFHKKGLWTSLDPVIAHGYCRGRSERFSTEGAMVCIVLDWRQLEEGVDYALEGRGQIVRFHGGLPPHVVEYVLTREAIAATGEARARAPRPWPHARFKRSGERWVPVQQVPVRYSAAATYATVEEFARLTLDRLLGELGAVAAVEVFSTLYALVSPWDALAHEDVLALLEAACAPSRRRGKWPTFRVAP